MCYSILLRTIFTTLFLVVLYGCGNASPDFLSPADVDLSPDAKLLYVTGHTGKKIIYLNTKNKKIVREVELELKPSGLTQSSDGKYLFVTAGGAEGQVFKIEAESGDVVGQYAVGHTPNSPLLSPDGQTLYVSNRFNNDVSFIDLKSGKVTFRAPVVREPVAMDLTPDGRKLFVANLLPAGRADVDYVASKISMVDTQSRKVSEIKLVNGAEGVYGVKVSPDGHYLFATHIMARFLVPTTQLERGWVATNALSVIRVDDQQLLYDVDLGGPNPWAIEFSEDGNSLWVTAAGSHEVSLIDLPKLTEKIQAEAKQMRTEAHMDAHNDLAFLNDIRQRIRLSGNGPRAIAVKGRRAYVGHYYSDSIDVVDFNKPSDIQVSAIELNPTIAMTPERQGEIFFHDATDCFQQWLSCATCHPDARTDAMNWDLLNDGMGNPKNVKSMLYSHKTPRTTWLGARDHAEMSVRAGFKHIEFANRPEEDSKMVDAYLKSLKPVPSPHLVKGRLKASAARGKKLFESIGCSHCHSGPLYTDMRLHQVGTTKGGDQGKPVDVPSLNEVWRTALYLHDGRAATIHDLLYTEDHAGVLYETSKLSEAERQDLEEYILSL